jgi:hypothetical protein
VKAAPGFVESFAIAGDTSPNLNVNFTGGVAGTLNINIPTGFIHNKIAGPWDLNVTIHYAPLVGTGAGGYTFNAATGVFDLILAPGNFTITDNTSHVVQLTGSFGYTVLHGTNGSSSLSLTTLANSVNYTLGTPFAPTWTPAGPGSLAIEFNASAPVAANATGPGSFYANDGMSFASP